MSSENNDNDNDIEQLTETLSETHISKEEKEIIKSIPTIATEMSYDINKVVLKKIINRANEFDVPVYVDPKGSDWGKYENATSITPNKKEIEISRKRLNVECLDVFQLTKPSISDLEDGELFSFLGELKNKGLCRYTGVIVGDIETGYQCIESGQVDCLQVLYHLLYQDTENLICEAKRKGLSVIVRSPLSSGLLTGNYTAKTKFDSNDGRSNYFSGVGFERRLKILHGIQKDLNIRNQELMGFSLRFILSNPGVSVIVPAASNAEQVRRLVSIGEGSSPFSSDELVKIKSTVMRYMEGVDIVVQN